MSNIIAGDPAPTNPTDRLRADILAGLRIAEAGSVGDETPDDLLDRYDALKRAEALAERDAKRLCSAFDLGEGSDAFIADYDALKRAEALAEAADRLRAATLLADDCACETFIRNQADGGESNG